VADRAVGYSIESALSLSNSFAFKSLLIIVLRLNYSYDSIINSISLPCYYSTQVRPYSFSSRNHASLRILCSIGSHPQIKIFRIVLHSCLRYPANLQHPPRLLLANHWICHKPPLPIHLYYHHTGTLRSTQLMLLKECVEMVDHPSQSPSSSYLKQFWKWPAFEQYSTNIFT